MRQAPLAGGIHQPAPNDDRPVIHIGGAKALYAIRLLSPGLARAMLRGPFAKPDSAREGNGRTMGLPNGPSDLVLRFRTAPVLISR